MRAWIVLDYAAVAELLVELHLLEPSWNGARGAYCRPNKHVWRSQVVEQSRRLIEGKICDCDVQVPSVPGENLFEGQIASESVHIVLKRLCLKNHAAGQEIRDECKPMLVLPAEDRVLENELWVEELNRKSDDDESVTAR